MPRQSTYAYYMGLKARLNQFYLAPSTNVAVSTTIGSSTYPQKPSPNYPMGYNNSAAGYYFWTSVYTSNATKGSVSIYYPWSETGTSVGLGRQINTNSYGYYNIQTNVVYGYSFNRWTAGYPGGPVVSYSNSYNLYYNDTYFDSSIYNNFN